MSVPSELKASSRRFIEQILLCRPTDPISFAVQYYFDERCSSPSVNHAIHSLTFLLRKPVDFRSAVATIYCAETAVATAVANESYAKEEKKEKLAAEAAAVAAAEKAAGTAAVSKDDKDDESVSPKDGDYAADGGGKAGGDLRRSDSLGNDVKGAAELSAGKEESASETQLSRLCNIARRSIASMDGTLAIACRDDKEARTAVSNGAINGIRGTEEFEWIFDAIEKFTRNEPISDAVSLNFETYISFLRLYLSLWASISWLSKATEAVQNAVATNNNGSSAFEVFDFDVGGGNDGQFIDVLVMEEDIQVLSRALQGVYNSCTPEEKMDMRTVVNRSFDIYVKGTLNN
jgi:hypothetical protein